jgi:hypothetical protein
MFVVSALRSYSFPALALSKIFQYTPFIFRYPCYQRVMFSISTFIGSIYVAVGPLGIKSDWPGLFVQILLVISSRGIGQLSD